MSVYVDEWDVQNQRATITVHEDDLRTAKVTYFGSDGKQFRVRVNQKPNPIGFHKRLPGDR